ncbi:MAG: ATP-dependent DNA helicase II subunit 2 [Piccolia ochrophora]|nr:MAG: ATP-dependent DNA helicase II subunit 2 [Piccolia ochrophora]
MAEKEATVYIVDVGSSMGEKHEGRDESNLDWAMQYVWDKITTTVATGRKTATIGVVGLRTDGTNNEMGTEENYENIIVFQPISQILMPELRELRNKIEVSSTDEGDAISALVIAIQMINTHCKKLKFRRKIVLVTNGRGTIDEDDLDEIKAKINSDQIELLILGIDFDDEEYGFHEKGKPQKKAKAESILKSLTEACDGAFGTMKQAIAELSVPRVKPVKPVPTYKGQLTLGDPATYATAMSIDVERYPRTMVAKVPNASQFVARSGPENGEGSMQSSHTLPGDGGLIHGGSGAANATHLASVKNTREYKVDDAAAPGGSRNVAREDLAKGYEYGRTAVHISESDENVTKLETKAGMELVGFVTRDQYERYMNMSTAAIIIAQKMNEKASMALSSFIHALFELDSYGITRLVTKDDKPPVLYLVAPSIETEYECLLEVQLPFAEDLRQYRFPPLDRIVTVSGKTLTEHRNLPSSQLSKAMSAYVDSMDLSAFEQGPDSEPTEYLPIGETYSPLLHRVNQVIRWRAVHPLESIPPPYEILTKYASPPAELLRRAEGNLNELVEAASVKKVPPKTKGRRRNRDAFKPLSGLNVEELLGREKRIKISTENAIPEFKQMLATTEDPNAIQDASKQMSTVVLTHIKGSFGDSNYGRALEELSTMREELLALEEPNIYNTFLRDLKKQLLAGELGGDRREMWWEIRKSKLGLIDHKHSEHSDTNEEDAQRFLSAT